MSRSRRYQLTINNTTDDDIDRFMSDLSKIRYFCCISGKGDNETFHTHIFVVYKMARTFKTIKDLNPRAHIEKCKGNIDSNITYFQDHHDLDTFYEYGDRPKQGKRNDIHDATELIKNGATMREVAIDHPVAFVKYHRGFTAFKSCMYKHRDSKPTVIWYYGATGTGKTRSAVEKSSSHYIKDHTQWWDGYEQQDVIIIDDFDGKWPYRDFLRLLDRYKYQGQMKGTYIPINSKFIIITCEFHPNHIYHGSQYAQVRRRIDQIICMDLKSIDSDTSEDSDDII